MRRAIIPVLIVALAAVAVWQRDRWLPQPPGTTSYLGYVEGETTLVAAHQAGRLARVDVAKGMAVAEGTVLFALDDEEARAVLAGTEATVAEAEAAHADLLTGKRPPELAVFEAQMEQARADLALARKELARASMLATSGTAAQAREDAARAQVEAGEGRLREIEAAAGSAALPGRDAAIAAAAARIDAAKAAVARDRRRLADLSPRAPQDATVEDVFFAAGEWVAAGQPVVSLLSPDDIALRFFVPEAALAAAAPGARVVFRCDGCGADRGATITRVAATPEFTPPVIYSEGARAKLVYLAEARPDAIDRFLRPGLPVEVEALP